MRDILYKNLTSAGRKRKVIATIETSDSRGVRSVVRRHFVYIAREIEEGAPTPVTPGVIIVKERNNKEQWERFFCKIKGSIVARYEDRLFLIVFVHSLRISLSAIPCDLKSF